MRTAELRDALIAVQLGEKHHRLIGTKDKKGHPLSLDDVCRACPSRKKCRKAAVALADMETRIL